MLTANVSVLSPQLSMPRNKPMTGFCLRIENLRFRYADRFRRSSFELAVDSFSPPSNCTAVIGENGCGKTTLGKLIAGILRPTSGSIYFNGADIAALALGEIGQLVGYLFQEPSRQIFAPNPLEEIAFPMELRGTPKDEAKKTAREYLAKFELSHIEDSTTYTLSRGEKQRLAIAAAMVMRPKYFVLDEPTTGLDKKRREMLGDILKKLLADGVGVLLFSHDTDFVKLMGADVYHVKGGRMVAP